jgi:hypothetical protein
MNIFQSILGTQEIKSVSFEEIKQAIEITKQGELKSYIINTLPLAEQDILIYNTIPIEEEESLMNKDIENYDLANRPIFVYGRNTTDMTAETKYKQLIKLGAKKVFLYRGGLFEWLLLQDIYGFSYFPTTKKITDILKYK